MNTFAYAIIAIGFLCIYSGARGQGLREMPGNLRDLGIAFATFDTDAIGEVLNRSSEPANNVVGFDKVEADAALSENVQNAPNLGSSGTTGPSGKTVADLVALGKALQARGFKVSENKALGDYPRPGVHLASGYHYKFDNSGAIDVNWPNAQMEAKMADAIVPVIRQQGFHVLWRVKGHYNHFHVDISRKDI